MGNLGNKKVMSKNIQYYMNKNDKTRQDLCDALGVKYTTLTDWIKGNTYPRIDKIELMANYFGISKSDLIEDRDSSIDALLAKYPNLHRIERRKFPMLGSVACGKPIISNEEYDSFVIADADIDADFCLTAKGDSMINARILDGDIVFIKSMQMVDNGQIAAVCVNDDEVTLKRFYYDRDAQMMRLIAENPLYPPMVYIGEELDHVHIVGKVVFFQSIAR